MNLKIYKNKVPVIHHITNYVTANDQANMVLAFGGSPVMADSKNEVEEITNLSDALVLNFGTLNDEKYKAMKISARKANEINIPIIIDPIGISVSDYRKRCMDEILNEFIISIIKCNEAELLTLADIKPKTIGIDSISENNNIEDIAKQISNKYNTCILKTGEKDVITYKNKSKAITGGSSLLKNITGTGCMLTSITAVCSVLIKDSYKASVFSSDSFKKASKRAHDKLNNNYEIGTFKVELFNQIRKIYNEEVRRR